MCVQWPQRRVHYVAMKHSALTAAAFEASLALLAVVLGWLLRTPPLGTFHLDLRDAAMGLAATLPALLLFRLCLKCPLRPFREITRIIDELVAALSEAGTWKRQGDFVSFIGTKTLRFLLNTN